MDGFREVLSHSAAETRRIGARLGEVGLSGDVYLLEGELGVGKTCLTQGIARGLGVQELVSSPSFVLIREYEGRLPLYHIDFYRLHGAEDVAELGLDDYLYGRGVCVVEWAERGLEVLPRDHLLVEMWHAGATRRRLRFAPAGSRYEEVLLQAMKTTRAAGK